MIRQAAPEAQVTSLPMPDEYPAAPYLKSVWLNF
jgi:hypothetical protein